MFKFVLLSLAIKLKVLLKKSKIMSHYLSFKSNTLVVIKQNGKKLYNPRIKNLRVNFKGRNNYIEIREPYFIRKQISIKCLGNNNTIKIAGNSNIQELFVTLYNDNSITIGENCFIKRLALSTNTANGFGISIGHYFLCSCDVGMRVSDAHVIYDINSKKILNFPQSINIGNHVWISQNVLVLKGAYIPDNCVVGAGSVVTKKFKEQNCIIAGVPAKVLKNGINWSICSAKQYIDEQFYNNQHNVQNI